jgi:UDP-N-acetylglucosamine 2-epimerase (non-hydrolysing)
MTVQVLHVLGARPNIPKFVPVFNAFNKANIFQNVIHTGQHYSKALTNDIFKDLDFDVRKIGINLEVGSGTHAFQVSQIIQRIEPELIDTKPKAVFVYGDVNSSLAAAIATKQLGLKLVHIESGLRSFDHMMIEEFNRILIDRCSDYLFCTLESSVNNLHIEGISGDKVKLVGNTMIDSLRYIQEKYNLEDILSQLIGKLRNYIFLTLHRPSNVDDIGQWTKICKSLKSLSDDFPIVASSHPRSHHLFEELKFIRLLKGIGYKESIALQSFANFVITDSGGLQEETTFLNKPCLTLRSNTERPETIQLGTNNLVNPEELMRYEAYIKPIIIGKKTNQIPFWDGLASQRILNNFLSIT